MIHIMTFTYLIGTTMTTTVEGDDAEAFCKEKEHLVIPVIGAQRPAVMENDRLRILRTPVFVINTDTIFRCYECHISDSSANGNMCEG